MSRAVTKPVKAKITRPSLAKADKEVRKAAKKAKKEAKKEAKKAAKKDSKDEKIGQLSVTIARLRLEHDALYNDCERMFRRIEALECLENTFPIVKVKRVKRLNKAVSGTGSSIGDRLTAEVPTMNWEDPRSYLGQLAHLPNVFVAEVTTQPHENPNTQETTSKIDENAPLA